MPTITETTWFKVTTPDHSPHVGREEGGHLRIEPKLAVPDITKLSRPVRFELIELEVVVRKAMLTAFPQCGIGIKNIDVHKRSAVPENCSFVVHLYGRVGSTVHQESSGNETTSREPLHEADVEEIRRQIGRILATGEFANFVNSMEEN